MATCGENVALDSNLAPQAADEFGITGTAVLGTTSVKWHDTGDGCAVSRDDQAAGVQIVQQFQTVLLEFSGFDLLHNGFP